MAKVAAKDLFFANMRSMASSSAADTTSPADEARRGAPPPIVDMGAAGGGGGGGGGDGGDGGGVDLLTAHDFPDDEAAVGIAWDSFRARHQVEWQPPAAGARFSENRHIHPSIRLAWLAAMSAAPGRLRVWHDEQPAPDDVKRAHVRPDFTLTVARDSAPSIIGALLLCEVKRPGDLDAAAYQLRAYLRRRVFKLSSEADARGEALNDIAAFGAATDGAEVVVARVASGAPAPGGSYARAVPCPARQMRPLPLFGAWDFIASPPPFWADAAPPAGFRALWRLCAAPQLLGGGAALESLLAAMQFEPGGDGAGGEATSAELRLTLDERLGSGGTSDVYAVGGATAIRASAGTATAAAAVAAIANGSIVLKAARVATAYVVSEFEMERSVLRALRGVEAAAGRVPVCVARGVRLREASHSLAGAAEDAAPWPVLLLHPRGKPLVGWVDACVNVAVRGAGGGGGNGGNGGTASAAVAAAAATARHACADTVVRSIFGALSAAHTKGFVHCDVRPGNIVVAEGDAVYLVDWGLACRVGKHIKRCGVAAFADVRVFTVGGVAASPALDILCALHTWLAIACGDAGMPPWARAGASEEDNFIARWNWLEKTARAPPSARVLDIARCAIRLQSRPLAEGGAGADDALDLARRLLEGGAGH